MSRKWLAVRAMPLVSPPEVKVVFDPEVHHDEEAWAKRLPGALTFLFPSR